MNQTQAPRDAWPELPHAEWTETIATVHLWTQIVGKVKLELSPWINHSWQATLYLTSRGLTTSPIPYGGKTFQIDFDFIDHTLTIATSDGRTIPKQLQPQTVADFYRDLMGGLDSLGIDVAIHTMPNEIEEPIPFEEDVIHSAYDPAQIHLLWRALVQTARVFQAFRARFIGKCSPVHLFWGSFDLAVTRFSGRPAPQHPGGIPHLPDVVTTEAYSQEVSSCGFWPGNAGAPDPIFYSYAYPSPDGFAEQSVEPDAAFWLADLGEFVLPYEAVRTSTDPDATLTSFLESTYGAVADLADWDRADFERPAGYTPYRPEG
jgi:hypothetical protein